MKTSVIGFPRIGAQRELKFATESYFRQETTKEALAASAASLRKQHWQLQQKAGIDFIPSNDFSFYDNLLDTAVMLGAIPTRYLDLGLDALDTYFAMARGCQDEKGDVKALSMKKWYDTNYHYIVPELDDDMTLHLQAGKVVSEFQEAAQAGVNTVPSVIGPFTFLKLAHYTGQKTCLDFVPAIISAYSELLQQLTDIGADWLAFQEPCLVTDLTADDIGLLERLYMAILPHKGKLKTICQTYFGDVRDCYAQLILLPFDAIGLDFIAGPKNLALIEGHGFLQDKLLIAGLINGRNIWRNHYAKTLDIVKKLQPYAPHLMLGTSCSLLHVPFTTAAETALPTDKKIYFSFACEKLAELQELGELADAAQPETEPAYLQNLTLFSVRHTLSNPAVKKRLDSLQDKDFIRLPGLAAREKLQKQALQLPLLPTTTIGSFPQTHEIRQKRADFKHGRISRDEYIAFNQKQIQDCISLQERLGLDVLVHGEFERNDMVEYFGDHLDGYLFTENGWVQSYGTRCVKPPVIWGDISRPQPITVAWSAYAQKLTSKPVKGMLTGPVTMLNWSFPREDIPREQSAMQLALAIRDEVLDLEKAGIKIIQIDEAALREKLPLRQADWHTDYLDWAIRAFRLVHSGVKPSTQIHTHMCYSKFDDIIKDIDAMDADVITFEASRSNLTIIDALNAAGFKTETGPGVYDIHSPRIPSQAEIKNTIRQILAKLPPEKLWINPDCGLKTRRRQEIVPSLQHLVNAAQAIRQEL
jgi:5-methyltetrahydropteroyltriglutamate--homocysteine methyltransferase